MRTWLGLMLCWLTVSACKTDQTGKTGGAGTVDDSGLGDTDDPADTGDTDEPAPPVATRIALSQQSALLTEAGAMVSLEATVYDQYGAEMPDVALEWSSNDSDTVSVEAGVATASGDWGSALLTVSAGELRSAPVTVLVADPVDGAILVDDSSVAGAEAVNPEAEVEVGWQYLVALSGVEAPAAGDVLVSTGDAAISGRVVSVVDEGDPMLVLMEGMAPSDLFDTLELQQRYTAEDILATVPEGMEGRVEVVETDDGYIEWSTPEGEAPPSLIGLYASAFECKADGAAPVIDISGFTMKVKKDGWHLDLDLDGIALQRLALEGRLLGEVRLKLAANAAFEGELKCEAQFLKFPLPVGPLGAVFGPSLDLGSGMAIKGRYTGASLAMEPYAIVTLDMALGLDCSSGCAPISEFSRDLNAGVSISNGDPGLTSSVEVETKAYIYAKLSIGARIAGVPVGDDFDVLVAEGGLKGVGNFMLSTAGQADDSAGASSVEIHSYVSAGLPPLYSEKIGKIFKVEVGTLSFEASDVLARTPNGTFAKLDDLLPLSPEVPVELKVELQEAYTEFFGTYNVAELVIYRRDTTLPAESQMTELVRLTPDADGQSVFTYEWTPTFEELEPSLDSSGEEVMPSLYAFVVPVLNPWPDMEYEVAPDSQVPLELNVLRWEGEVAVQGGVDVAGIDSNTGSIDADGRIGFIGIDSSGEERPYAWTETGGVEDMATTYTVSRTYSGGSIASGQGVAASDNGAGFNFVRVWEGTDWTTIGCGEYCYDTSIGMSFGAAIGFFTSNSSGDVCFYSLDQAGGYDPYSGWDTATVRVYRGGSLLEVGTETQFLLRPSMSESGTVVWRDSTGQITVDGGRTLGSTSSGLWPGISDNGDRVMWTDESDRIYFASSSSSWVEVPLLDAGDHEKMSSIELDERIGAGLINQGDEDIVFAVFLGTDADGTAGVFVVQAVDGSVIFPEQTHITPLVLEGDVIDGVTVSDFYLYDPVSPSGDIVVMASTGSNDALLRFSLLE